MIGFDVIVAKRKKYSFEEWCEIFEEDLWELFHLEGANYEHIEYEDWLDAFYYE